MLGRFSEESLRAFAEFHNLNTGNQDFSEGVFDFKVCQTPKGERYGVPERAVCAPPNKPVARKMGKDFFGRPTKENIDEAFKRTVAGSFNDDVRKALRGLANSSPYELGDDARDLSRIVDHWSGRSLTQGQARVLNQVFKDIQSAFAYDLNDDKLKNLKIPRERLNDAKMTINPKLLVERDSRNVDPAKAMGDFLADLKADAPKEEARRKREKQLAAEKL